MANVSFPGQPRLGLGVHMMDVSRDGRRKDSDVRVRDQGDDDTVQQWSKTYTNVWHAAASGGVVFCDVYMTFTRHTNKYQLLHS